MLRGDEKYVTVQGTLKKRTAKAIFIENEHGDGWVPRSCVHFMTDKAADEMALGDEGEFRIMEWIASDRGFI